MNRWKSITLLCTVVLAAGTTLARNRFDSSAYLPGAMHHLDQSRIQFESGNLGESVAHSRLILHDQGLKVFVEHEVASKSQEKSAERAIAFWNEVLGSGSLERTDRAESADVTIVYQAEVNIGGTPVGGYCSQSRFVGRGESGEAKPEYRATIVARTRMPNGQELNEDCLVNIVAHEIGHVYGLNDCTDPGHLMSALNPSRPKFSLQSDELEALQRFRLTAFEILRSAEAEAKGN